MPNVVSLTHPSLQILGKTQMVVFSISGFLVNLLYKKISRTSDDNDVKLRTLTKLDERNKKASKKLVDDVVSVNYDVMVFSQFVDNLDQFGSRIPDA